jgi:hypothetical protein
MTDDKCEVVRRKLEQLLRQQHFEWVADAVEEQIRLGKTKREVVEVTDEPELTLSQAPPASPRRRRAPKDKFLRRVEYTPRERLTLTIAALEHAVVDAGEIGIHLNEFISKRTRRPAQVLFAPDEDNTSPRPSSIHAMPAKEKHLRKLRSLLAELRKEVTKDAN